MKKPNKIFLFYRFFLGILFLISGGEKLLSPVQNFVYVIQSYELIPTQFEIFIAYAIPAMEIIVGIFLLLGLWIRFSLYGAQILFLTFIGVVAQALIRHLPVDECGCFGELISIPLWVVLAFDSMNYVLTSLSLQHVEKMSQGSLDQYFSRQ